MHPIERYEWIHMFSIMFFIISVIDMENGMIGNEGNTEGMKFIDLGLMLPFGM